jgi:hypothetical protein
MADINGSYRRGDDRPIVTFEARQDGERWTCLAKVSGERFEASTWQPSPWPCIEKLIGEALDSASREIGPARFDMNQRLVKRPVAPTPLHRRGKFPPGSVPEWRPPETD